MICMIDAIAGKESKEREEKIFNSFMTFSIITSAFLFALILLIQMVGIADIDWFWMYSQ